MTSLPPILANARKSPAITMWLLNILNIPTAEDKLIGPTTVLPFLHILLDTQCLEASLPLDILAQIKEAITSWLSISVATKRGLLSLIALLSFAAKVVGTPW